MDCVIRQRASEGDLTTARKWAEIFVAIPGTKPRWGLQGRLMMIPYTTSNNTLSLLAKVQLRLATVHAKHISHVLGLLNHALQEPGKSTQSETPHSPLRSIKLH